MRWLKSYHPDIIQEIISPVLNAIASGTALPSAQVYQESTTHEIPPLPTFTATA